METIDVSGFLEPRKLSVLYLDIYGFLNCFPNSESMVTTEADLVYVTLKASELDLIPTNLYDALRNCTNFIFNVYQESEYVELGEPQFGYNLYDNKETSDLAKAQFEKDICL